MQRNVNDWRLEKWVKAGVLVLSVAQGLAPLSVAARGTLPPKADAGAAQRTVAPTPEAVDLQQSFARVADAVKPAVVSLTTSHTETAESTPHEFYFGDPFDEFFRDFFG